MKGFVLALDGIHAVFHWIFQLGALAFFAFLWWARDLEWWKALLFLLLAWLGVFIVGILYRLGTYPLRSELIREAVVRAWKDGILTEEQRDESFKRWQEGTVWHVLFGVDPTR